MASRRWDVQAKPDRVASPDQIRPMLRALLEDRFQLRSHSEKRERPVYELSVDRNGSKLQRVKDETKADVRVGAGLIQLTKAMAATFASQLSYALGRPVIDQTNLSGDRTVSEARSSGFTRPNFGRCSEQLGLRLKSGRGPVEVIMIDEAQMPTVN